MNHFAFLQLQRLKTAYGEFLQKYKYVVYCYKCVYCSSLELCLINTEGIYRDQRLGHQIPDNIFDEEQYFDEKHFDEMSIPE